MKKKITAAALALCLVLGLLPMSVLAARYTGTLNGQEITIDVDDTTGAVTLPEGLAAHYGVAPEKLTIDTTTGKFPKSQKFTLTEHYGNAPGTIEITGTLVEEPAAKTFTVTFAAGDHATGEKAAVTLTVPNGEIPVEYTLPDKTGFTPASGYVFSGWKVGDATAVKAAGEKITVSADVTLTAQWTKDETVVTVTPRPDNDGNATVAAKDVTVTDGTETVVLDLSTHESAAVTIQADLVTSVKNSSVETVKIQTSSATADVPVDVLPASGDAKVEVKPVTNPENNLPAGTADAVKTAVTGAKAVSVAVTDKDGNNLLRKKDSYQATDLTVTITINGLIAGKNYVVLCLSVDGAAKSLTSFGKYASIAGTTLEVKSKHLSDFIAVEETADNAAALAAVAEDPGKADGTVTPPETTVKVESVKTDVAPFTKVHVSGLSADKVYLIRIGAGTDKAGQAVFVVEKATSYDFYCNTDSVTHTQTVMVWERDSKTLAADESLGQPTVTETVAKVS